MKPKFLIEVFGILAMLAVVIAGYVYAPVFFPKPDVSLALSDCDPGVRTCRATLPDGGTLEISLSPLPVPLVKPFKVEVRLSGVTARQVEVDFAAIGMDMGINRVRLAEEKGLHSATASLPVCITGPMAWQATVLIETASARMAIPFRFSTRS